MSKMITFHIQNQDEIMAPIFYLSQVINKYVQDQFNVEILTKDPMVQEMIDRILWIYPHDAFIPHRVTDHGVQTLLAQDKSVSINFGLGMIDTNKHSMIVECVFNTESHKAIGRDKFKLYKQKGYTVTVHKEVLHG